MKKLFAFAAIPVMLLLAACDPVAKDDHEAQLSAVTPLSIVYNRHATKALPLTRAASDGAKCVTISQNDPVDKANRQTVKRVSDCTLVGRTAPFRVTSVYEFPKDTSKRASAVLTTSFRSEKNAAQIIQVSCDTFRAPKKGDVVQPWKAAGCDASIKK